MKKVALFLFLLLIGSISAVIWFHSSHYTAEIFWSHTMLKLGMWRTSRHSPDDVLRLYLYYMTNQKFDEARSLTTGEMYDIMNETLPLMQQIYQQNDISERMIRFETLSVNRDTQNRTQVEAKVWIQMIQNGQSRIDLEYVVADLILTNDGWKILSVELKERYIQPL